jgi:cell division protein FtsZ
MQHLFPGIQDEKARLCVVGVGGAGGNAVNTMVHQGLQGVEVIAVNTDRQALDHSHASMKLVIGTTTTKGLGAGANPGKGRAAAEENEDAIASLLQGKDLVFVAAGMGGGTGTGAAPTVARVARECGALTVGVVTRPFDFEGKARRRHAEAGLAELAAEVDSLIVVPNQQLLSVIAEDATVEDSFRLADQVLFNAVSGLSRLVREHGLVNVDFADVRTVLSLRGVALMGTGIGRGERRSLEAVHQAISSPLLDNVGIEGARGVLLHFTGGPNMTLTEIRRAADIIEREAHDDVNLIFGASVDPKMTDEIRVTVVATGFDKVAPQYHAIQAASQRAQHDTAPTPAVEVFSRPAPLVAVAPTPPPLPAALTPAVPASTPSPPPVPSPAFASNGPRQRSRLLERATSLPVPGVSPPVFASSNLSSARNSAPPAVAPLRSAARVLTIDKDPEELAVPPAHRAVRQTGESKMGADFWSEPSASGESDPSMPSFARRQRPE